MFESRSGAALTAEGPAAGAVPRPDDRIVRLRAALAGPPGAALAAAMEEARDPGVRERLRESDLLGLIAAGPRQAAWDEWCQLQDLEGLWRSRRRLGGRDLAELDSIDDVAALVARAQAIQDEADDLAARSVVAEAAITSGTSEYALDRKLRTALELRRLPGTNEALRTGMIDLPRVHSIAAAVRDLSDAHAASVEARCLPAASRQSCRGLQEALDRAVIEIAPEEAARRHAAGKADRRVTYRMGRDIASTNDGLPDGTGEMIARMSAAELLVFRRKLDIIAKAAKTGQDDRRTLNQLRIDVLNALVANGVTHLGPDEGTEGPTDPSGPTDPGRPTEPTEPTEPSRPSGLTEPSGPSEQSGPSEPSGPSEQRGHSGQCGPTDGPQADEPTARINGSVLPAPGQPGGSKEPEPSVVVLVGLDTLLGNDQCPGELLGYGPIPAAVARDLASRGVWRCAVTDEHGTVLGLGRSTFTPAYRPPGATADLVRLRDRTCVFPGCRRQARLCDLDHRRPHRVGGATCECNLQALCGHHHRLKHEAGFHVRISEEPDDPPGTLDWTTPTGRHVPRYPVPAGRSRLPDEPPF